ncbi:hypothetical protein ACIA5D_15150 [Actinoplanes sp. NPDC051513]|uniref:hypothetical protein n=1 Tax=Actinoplanes sp. NPDC051513 TaxID=3363908 RepID=UPI0037A41A33
MAEQSNRRNVWIVLMTARLLTTRIGVVVVLLTTVVLAGLVFALSPGPGVQNVMPRR